MRMPLLRALEERLLLLFFQDICTGDGNMIPFIQVIQLNQLIWPLVTHRIISNTLRATSKCNPHSTA